MKADSPDRHRRQVSDHPRASGTNHADAVRRVFDDRARTGMADGMERRHKRLAELMLERFRLPGDARVLDIGCGNGWTARMLAHRVPEGAFVGIDPSREMIFRARRCCEDLENALFVPASAEQIPWAEDYFTHVISIESAYYWSGTNLAAKEIYRVTAYGGSFHILINYYAENPYSEGWDSEMGLSLHRLSGIQWAAVFRAAGFEEIVTERIPDDSPIPLGTPRDELARREGLQQVGALYVTGKKPSVPEGPAHDALPSHDPFCILR